MRVFIAKSLPGDSNAKGLKLPLAILLVMTGIGLSVAGGAWLQAWFSQRDTGLNLGLFAPAMAAPAPRAQVQVQVLADKLGSLQAQLIELSGLSRRVARAAGVAQSDPEIQSELARFALPVLQGGVLGVAPASAAGLGLMHQLDALQDSAARQYDWFSTMDLALTRRAGMQASLPTYAPVDYPYQSSSYGWRRHPITGRRTMHEGLDFAAPRGTPIYAASSGVVSYAGYRAGYGKVVEIQHGNDLVTRYAHASKLNVQTGDLVERGQIIAKVGSTGLSTGSHLHFEVRLADQPLDPSVFLAQPEARPTLATAGHDPDGAPQVR